MEQLHIIPEPVGLMRKIARDALKGHWKEVAIGVFIFNFMTSYIATILDTIFPVIKTYELYGQTITLNESFAGQLYTQILTGAFLYGMALFLLTFFRTKKTNNGLIFEGFSIAGKSILLQIVIFIRVFLWSLLFIVPGIIAGFRYSQAYYILADHPEYSVTQCIEESKARMNGNKGTLFLLELSFIGWAILASLASGGLMSMFGTSTVSALIGGLVGTVPSVILAVYMKTAETVFYELLTQNLVVMVPDQHVQNQGVNPGNMVNANYEVHETPVIHYEAEGTDASDYVQDAETFAGTEAYEEPAAPVQEEPYDAPSPEVEIHVDPEDVIQADVMEEQAAPEVIIMGGPVDEGPEIVIEDVDEVDAFGAPKDEKDEL